MLTVSVIIPNYNNEKYLTKCIDSVLSQTYPIKEIVIYDDCSSDNSRNILKFYNEKYSNIKVIFGEKNVGVSTARDIAIKSTTSDYVCMLDADDFFFDNDKLKKEMNTVEDFFEKTQKKIIAFSQTIDVDETGIPLINPKLKNLCGKERFKIVTRLYKNYMPRDYCFPRELYLKIGGYTKELSLFEDWELNIKFLEFTDFVFSGCFGTAYRHKKGGLSSVNYKKQFIVKNKIISNFKLTLFEKFVFYLLAIGAYFKNLILKK